MHVSPPQANAAPPPSRLGVARPGQDAGQNTRSAAAIVGKGRS